MKMIFALCVFLVVFAVPHAYAADSLCPDLEHDKSATPDNVAGVQADIERLNLCVARAQLLKQLDDIAGQRMDVLRKANGVSENNGDIAMPAMNGTGGIPPLPISALPSLPAEKAAASAQIAKAAGLQVKTAAANPLDESAPPSQSWQVRKIWGQGAGMHAQLSDGSGTLLNVIKGDPLPDGKVVEAVSARGVTISQNGKISDLSWDNQTLSGNANNAAQATP